MNADGVRKAFEAWALSERLDVRRLGDGRYLLLTVQEKWVGWQAATRAAVPAWQPIDTAPKDGTVVLARIPDQDVPQAVVWSDKDQCWVIQWDYWKLTGFDIPTYWMPLPPAEEKT